jgi:hypothetical protein
LADKLRWAMVVSDFSFRAEPNFLTLSALLNSRELFKGSSCCGSMSNAL